MTDLQWNKEFSLEQTGGDAELLAELLELLSSTSLADLEKIRAALAAGDGEAVADAAHSIKGAAASLGVEGLRQSAYEFEKKGRAAELDGLDLAELKDLIGQLAGLHG
ncbi:MAG: Hpt domain-containing protein [Deltaproteobacteria bacterium]|nr:Hpt domain-containing protein [Deltaproteobacteria bacterium]